MSSMRITSNIRARVLTSTAGKAASSVALAGCFALASCLAVGQGRQALADDGKAMRPAIAVVSNIMMALNQPAGIVVTGGALCRPTAEPVVTPASMEDVQVALSRMGLSVTNDDGVVVVRDGTSRIQEDELEHVVARFSPPPSTMSGEGAILDGIVTMEMDRPESFIGSTLIGNDAHQVSVGPQANRTTMQLMDALVRLDGKGVWILHRPVPVAGHPGQISHRGTIEVQSYVDDVPHGNVLCRPSDIDQVRNNP
jgi:hypothetical protein